ncbi:MAG: RHS repeat domain-containing protein [Bacteroides nordii]
MRSRVEKTQFYDSRGLPSSISAAAIMNMAYTFNDKANLISRSDLLTGHKEDFTYDTMNRLIAWNISKDNVSQASNSIDYNPTTGTITTKSDVGFTFGYGEENGKPHALTSLSGKPDKIPNSTQTVTYTDFKKVKNISLGNQSLVLDYGVDEQRRKGIFKDGNATFTRYYSGNYEEEINSSGKVKKIHYISGGDGLAGIYINDDGNNSLYSTYCDYQGSLLALTDMNGVVKERYAYDPWGNRRNPALWKDPDTRTKFIIDRGYTLHEHLDGLGLINMNGRVYDPLLGMFLSPDPYVQAPGNWLNYNRYGYCYGNPLLYTDPDGEIAWLIPAIIGVVIGAYTGGTIANDGQYNPAKWDYSSGKTWGYMFGGAVVGRISGVTGWAIAGSGMPMANTAAIAGSSLTNSLGTWAYTGGQTPVSISLGLASYDLKSSQWGFLGKKGNSTLENVGYGFGGLANLVDANLLINSTPATLYTDDSDFISHSAVVKKNVPINYETGDGILMSFGPNDAKVPNSKLGYATYFRRSTSYYNVYDKLPVDIPVNKYVFTTVRGLGKILPFQGITTNCVNMSSLSLWLNGIPNVGLHPYLLHATIWGYSAGIRPDLFSYYLTNKYKR